MRRGLRRMRPKPSRVVFVFLLAFWAFLLSRLEPDAAPVSVAHVVEPSSVASVAPASASAYRLGIYNGGERVGWMSSVLRIEDDGFRLTQETQLRLTVVSERRDIRTRVSARLASDFSVLHAVQLIESEGARFRASVRRDGGLVHYETGFASDLGRGTIALAADQPLHLAATVRLAVAEHLEAGRELEYSVFDPLAMRFAPMVVRVIGREPPPHGDGTEVWRLEERLRGLEASVWMDEAGRVWGEDAMMGFQARVDPSLDPPSGRALAALDVEGATGVPVGAIRQPRERDELHLRLTGMARESLPTGPTQEFDGEHLVLRRARLDHIGSYRLPYPDEGSFAELLQPGPWLQSDHPRVRALAERILEGEADALTAAGKLVDWVYGYLEKVPTLSVPNALEVLDSGRGDCNEHAVLFTALARAAGLPSRVVAGLVYADGRFVYHAWSEVRGAQAWLPVDPALGQIPADATHIALAHGELWEIARLVAVVGSIQLEVVGE